MLLVVTVLFYQRKRGLSAQMLLVLLLKLVVMVERTDMGCETR